jgi:hypothetical protein
VEAEEEWSGDELEPVELTPEQVRDGRLAAITQHTRVLKEFAQKDPLGALRRWGELHPGNTRRMHDLIDGLVRMGVGRAVGRVEEQEEASDALEESNERLRGARRDFIEGMGEPDLGRDEPAWINRLKARSEEIKAARATRALLSRRENKGTKPIARGKGWTRRSRRARSWTTRPAGRASWRRTALETQPTARISWRFRVCRRLGMNCVSAMKTRTLICST